MVQFIIYISISLLLLYLGYKLILAQQKFLKTNRLILLLIPILPIFIYFFNDLIRSSETQTNNIVQITLNEVSISASEPIISESISIMEVSKWIYILGVALGALFCIVGYFKIIRKLKSVTFQKFKNEKINIAYTDDLESFSFFNYIHINNQLSNNDDVLHHEMVHVMQKHSWDILVYNIFRVLFWFHPVIYLLEKELKLVHEYLADEKVGVVNGKENYANTLLNIYFGTGSIQFINQFNNQKFIKMRLKMLSKNQKKSQVWRYVSIPAFLVVLSLGVSSFKSNNTNNANMSAAVTSDPVYDSVDVMPTFKGGMDGLIKFMGEQVKYPKQSANDGVEGKVFVEFVVTKNGQVKDAKILKGINDELNAESLRVINAMPNWTPGEKDGKKVNVKMVLPIAYKL